MNMSQLTRIENPVTHWQIQHNAALDNPRGFEKPVVGILRAIYEYALEHQIRYGCTIMSDGVLGPEFLRIVNGLHGLLNNDCGRLDRGRVSKCLNFWRGEK